MSAPIYFLPNAQLPELVQRDRFNPQILAERGLSVSLGNVRSVRLEASCFEQRAKGPGGHSGVMVCVTKNRAPARLGFYPDQQTWHERPAGAQCWVGIDPAEPPTPADLAHRTPLLGGYDVELGDGSTWKVPVLRRPGRRNESRAGILPHDMRYDQHGGIEWLLRPAYKQLWELSGVAYDHYYDRESQPKLEWEVVLDLALGVLGLNYRVGKIEQNVMGLINSENWDGVIESSLDLPTLREAMAHLAGDEKKSAEV